MDRPAASSRHTVIVADGKHFELINPVGSRATLRFTRRERVRRTACSPTRGRASAVNTNSLLIYYNLALLLPVQPILARAVCRNVHEQVACL